MNSLTLETLADVFQRVGVRSFPDEVSVVCAVSGGLDSTVLAHLMARSGCRLRALHVDHAAHADSAKWARSVTAQMTALGVPAQVHRIEPSPDNLNLEAYWRAARLAVFDQEVEAHEVLVTAHHRDDQAETLLLQLMRGSGPTGLQAMPLSRRLAGGSLHIRPLLDCARADLERYARQHGLTWIDDPSNQDQHHDRNYVRRSIMPMLTARWPGAVKAMVRSASLIAESVALDVEQAKKDAQFDGPMLDWARLARLSAPRQANAVRYWLHRLGIRYPHQRQLEEALRQWQTAEDDRLPELELETGKVQRYRASLVYAEHRDPVPEKWSGELRPGDWLSLPSELGQIGLVERSARAHELAPGRAENPLTDLEMVLPGDSLARFSVRFRQNGERLRRSATHHQSLKHWFQEAGIPPVLRSRWPLVFMNDELIAVAARWVDDRFRSRPAAKRRPDAEGRQKIYSLIWRQPPGRRAK